MIAGLLNAVRQLRGDELWGTQSTTEILSTHRELRHRPMRLWGAGTPSLRGCGLSLPADFLP